LPSPNKTDILHNFTDETWILTCHSLGPHPKLENLTVRSHGPSRRGFERKRIRTQALVELVEANTVIQRIDIEDDDKDEQLFRDGVLPTLSCNQFRPRLREIQQAPSNSQRQLIGEALQEVRNDPCLLFMVLTAFPTFTASASRDSVDGDGDRKRKAHP
jgi:hypothetical protein